MGDGGIQGMCPPPSFPKKNIFSNHNLAGTEGKLACFRGKCPSESPLIDISRMFHKALRDDLQ